MGLERTTTGLYSLDSAFGGGLPLGSIYEIYGYTHVGKSSLAYYLAMKIAKERKICVADFEGFDSDYIYSTAEMADYNPDNVTIELNPTAEEGLTALRDSLFNEEYGAGILDTVGAMVLNEELKNEVNLEERLGQKPKLMAKAMRQFVYVIKHNPTSVMFVLNHLHPIITLGRGSTTTGGVAIHNLSAARMKLSADERNERYSIVSGKIDKFRYGGKGKTFKFGIISNRGVHPGFTALLDCLYYGLAEKSTTIKMDGNSHGYLKTITDKAYEGDDSVFDPFIERISQFKEDNSYV